MCVGLVVCMRTAVYNCESGVVVWIRRCDMFFLQVHVRLGILGSAFVWEMWIEMGDRYRYFSNLDLFLGFLLNKWKKKDNDNDIKKE